MKKPVKKIAISAVNSQAPSSFPINKTHNDLAAQPVGADKDALLEKYTELYDFAPTGFFTLNRQAIVCELNLSGALLLGQHKTSITGKPFTDFLTGEALITFTAFFKKLFEINVKTSCEILIDNPFNGSLYVHIEGIVTAQGTNALLVAADISERRRAEAELKRRDKIFSMSQDMHCIAGFDGYFKVLNSSWTRTLGWSTETLISKPWIDFVHPDDKEASAHAVATLLYSEEMVRFEHRFLCINGIYRQLEWNAFSNPSDNTMISVARDITEKKEAEEKNNSERNLLRTLIDQLPDAIYIKDLQGRKIITNPMDLKIMNREKEGDILGKTDLEIFPADTGAVSYSDDMQVLQTGNALIDKEEIFYDRNGHQFCVLTSKLPLRNEQQQITGLLGIGKDITDRKIVENELLHLNENLKKRAGELADSNEDLERFAYIASHDLQEPLRMVSGFLKLLERNYEPVLEERAKQYIHFAVDGANRMKYLITDLLEYSKVGTNKDVFVETDMNLVLQEVIANFAKQDEEIEPLITHSKLPTIYANKSQMMQLLQNLVGNAVKYKSQERPVIDIKYQEEPDHFLFSVKDNGIGIDGANFKKIFNLFQRLHIKEEYAGTGIGLATCKKIADRHGGQIWVESTLGRGSTFYFTIRKQSQTS